MRYSFVGEIDANMNLDAKVPYYREIKGGSTGASISLSCIAAKNNRAYIEVVGFKNDEIQTIDTNGNKIKVLWRDRFDNDVIKSIANYRKHVITLDGERNEFITEYDFVDFIKNNIEQIKGNRFAITGQIKKNVYNGKITDKFIIQNMYEVAEDDERKNQLMVTGDFYFNKESIDTADWKEEKKLYINGYTKEWMSKDEPNAYVDRQLVFDCNKLNFDNSKHIDILNYRLAQIGCEYSDGKIEVKKLKKNKWYAIDAITSYYSGAEEIEFDESELTDNQRKAIALGLKTLDDFRPAGNIYGNRVVIYKLTDFGLKGDYSDGCIEVDSIEDDIYVIPQDEKIEDIEKKIENAGTKEEDAEIDDLFA